MSEPQTQQEYRTKKMEVIHKFREQFMKANYLYDPLLHSVVEMLIRDADPYTIIEELIKMRQQYMKETEQRLMHEPVRFIIP